MHDEAARRPDADARASGAQTPSSVRKLYAAEVLSGAGDGIFWVALIASLAEEPHFGLLLGFLVLARLGPRAFFSVRAGSVLDRADVRAVLIGVDIARAVMMFALAVLVGAGGAPLLMLVVVFVSYVVGVPTRPGLTVALAHLAGEARLAHANATLSSIRQTMTFVGPVLGVPIAFWSPAAGVAVNGVSFVASAFLVASAQGPWPKGDVPLRRIAAIAVPRAGGGAPRAADLIRSVEGLPALVILVGAMYFVRGAEMVLYVFVVRDILHAEPSAIGFLGGAAGLGAIVAAPLARRASESDRPARWVGFALVLTAGATIALAAVGRLVSASALLGLVGAGMVVFEVVSVGTIQRVAAPATNGRVFGIVNGVSNAGKLAGAVVAAIIATAFDTEGALVVVALSVSVVGVILLPQVAALGRRSAARRQALLPTLEVLDDLGLFDGAPRWALERVASAVIVEPVIAGTVLIVEGAAPDDLFVARDGDYAVARGGQVVNTLHGGDWFGEIGLVNGVPRTATVTATSDGEVWRIPGDVFLSSLEDAGAPPDALVEGIASRLARGDDAVGR
jgi:Cyclic nucleotide-binding domain/Transmembrane secretion effector